MNLRDAVCHPSDTTADRSQSEVLGVVLLLGLVAITAIGIVVVGGAVVSETTADAEKEQIEQSFTQLSHAMESATEDGESVHEATIETGDSGAVTKTDAGSITIKSGDGELITGPIDIGAIEYEHEDGSVVAYQAGGVWADRGNESRVLSAPPISYDPDAEELSLPITTVSEGIDLQSGQLSLELVDTNPVRGANVVEDDSVEVTIQSPYYRGWEAYFRSESGDGVIRNVDHANESITVQFGPMTFEDALEHGATYEEEPGGSNPSGITEEGQNGTLQPMDDLIYELVDDANDGTLDIDEEYGDIQDHESLTSGTYLVDSIDEGTLAVDLSDGNVTIIVDGDVVSPGEGDFITVTEHSEDHELKIYATGHLDMLNGGDVCVGACGEDTDASIIQFYGTSETTVNFEAGNAHYEGIIYAASDKDSWDYEGRTNCPPEEYQAAFQSGVDFTGSIIVSTICGHSDAYEFSYDDSLSDADIDPYPDGYEPPPHITYLTVSLHEVHVDNR